MSLFLFAKSLAKASHHTEAVHAGSADAAKLRKSMPPSRLAAQRSSEERRGKGALRSTEHLLAADCYPMLPLVSVVVFRREVAEVEE